MVYADYAASAPVSEAAKRAMAEYMELYGNPSSSHAAGEAARLVIGKAREQVARLIGCEADEIYFTSGGTEACNLAILGGYEYAKSLGKARIVTSSIEHAAVMRPIGFLEARGVEVLRLEADERADGESTGRVSIEGLEAAISRSAGLVCLMYANNETGTLQHVREASALAHSAGALLFSDAVAAVGRAPISVKDDAVDMLSISGHKLGAPAGIGALYVRRGVELSPMILGGGQERGLRSGTEPTLLIAAFGAACLASAERMSDASRIGAMRDRIAQALLSVDGSHRNGDAKQTLSGTLNISFDGVGGEELANLCNLRGLCISTGSACSSGEKKPSAALMSMGLPAERALEAVRISIGEGTTEDDAHKIVKIVTESVNLIRKSQHAAASV